MFNPSDPSSPAAYPPSFTALLLLDFHALFVSHAGGPGAVPAAETAARLRTWANAKGVHVIHAIVDVDQSVPDWTKDKSRFDGFIAMMRGQPGGEESEVVTKGEKGEKEVTFKRTPGLVSALTSEGIKEYLKENGIKSLIMTGLSTGGCVMRTAVPATDEGYIVTVIKDATSDMDQDIYNVVVDKLLPTRSYVMTADEFTQGYDGALTA